jgi:hypothetical protein
MQNTKNSAMNLYKNLYKFVRNNSLSNDKGSFAANFNGYIRNEFQQNSVTDGKYCVEENQQKILADAYLTYLQSTNKCLNLYDTYAKGERSIKDSAAIVGLGLPKTYQPPNE